MDNNQKKKSNILNFKSYQKDSINQSNAELSHNENLSFTEEQHLKTNKMGYNVYKDDIDEEVKDMENTWLKQYISQLDKDSKDFKQEMRERDQRSEQRIIEMEKRLFEQNKASEERINKSMTEMREIFKNIDIKLEDTKKTVADIEKQNRQFNIANFIAIVALVIAIMFGLYQINTSLFDTIIDLVTKIMI